MQAKVEMEGICKPRVMFGTAKWYVESTGNKVMSKPLLHYSRTVNVSFSTEETIPAGSFWSNQENEIIRLFLAQPKRVFCFQSVEFRSVNESRVWSRDFISLLVFCWKRGPVSQCFVPGEVICTCAACRQPCQIAGRSVRDAKWALLISYLAITS